MQRPTLYEKFDIKSPTYVHNNLYKNKKNKETKWAIGTVAKAPDEDRRPKRQQFKIYYFSPEYNNKDPENYKKFIFSVLFDKIFFKHFMRYGQLT